MKLILTPGSTSVIAHIFIKNSAVTTGAGLPSLAHTDVTCWYVRSGGTLAQLTPQTIATLGTYAAPTANTNIRIKLVSDANAPGLYEVQFHNDHLAAGAGQATFIFTATGAQPEIVEVQLAAVPANLTQILGTALTETSGLIAAAFKKFFNVAAPTGSVNSLPDAAPGSAPGLAIVGSDMGMELTAQNIQDMRSAPVPNASGDPNIYLRNHTSANKPG